MNAALRLPLWRARTSRFLRWSMLAAGMCVTAFGTERVDASLLTTERREMQREGRMIVELLQNLHYSTRQFHEIEAKEIVEQFVRRNDSERLVLSAEDVAFLHRRFDRTLKTVYLLKGDVQPAFEIFDLYRERARERLRWISTWLDGEIDLSVDEVFRRREPESAPLSGKDLERAWELRLKRALVDEMAEGRTYDEAVAEVRRGYERWGKMLEEMSAREAREQFWESLIALFDPHSGYSGPERAEEFQIGMKGAVAGVGLDVWMDDGVCLVASVLDGGAAEREGSIAAGDEIVALAEDGGEWTKTKGKRRQTIVARLRGKPGTTLRLAYRRGHDAERREVTLERTEVVLPDQRARGAVFEVPGSGGVRKIGWVELPDFYASGIDSVDSSATRDVRELIDAMKVRGVDGVVLDLRRNPGGAMTEAIALTGLFIEGGPVFVTRGMDGKTEVHRAPTAEPFFGGPLVVAVSRQSASASEIVGGALQYYQRAVIVGAKATFGKGTAQTYIDFNASPQRAGAKSAWGMLRVTGQRFYLPDGRSPQMRGTESDIVFPHDVEEAETESKLPHALPGDEIAGVKDEGAGGRAGQVNEALLARLRARVEERTSALEEWDLRRRAAESRKRWTEQKDVSVQLERRKAERAEVEKEMNEIWKSARKLEQTEGYRAEVLATAAVRQVQEEHLALARSRMPEGADARAGWIAGNRFFLEGSDGVLREVRLDRVEFGGYIADATVLTAEFSAATNLDVTGAALADVLRALERLEGISEAGVLGCFKRVANEVDAVVVKRGAEAVLRKLTELDPGLLLGRPMLDVGLRESLRIAADWVDWLKTTEGDNSAALDSGRVARGGTDL